MRKDFYILQINQELCIHCNICQKVCPVIKNKRNENSEILCYAAYSKDEEIRKKSSSGGIFTEQVLVYSMGGEPY